MWKVVHHLNDGESPNILINIIIKMHLGYRIFS